MHVELLFTKLLPSFRSLCLCLSLVVWLRMQSRRWRLARFGGVLPVFGVLVVITVLGMLEMLGLLLIGGALGVAGVPSQRENGHVMAFFGQL